jgi:hypothetical protein
MHALQEESLKPQVLAQARSLTRKYPPTATKCWRFAIIFPTSPLVPTLGLKKILKKP